VSELKKKKESTTRICKRGIYTLLTRKDPSRKEISKKSKQRKRKIERQKEVERRDLNAEAEINSWNISWMQQRRKNRRRGDTGVLRQLTMGQEPAQKGYSLLRDFLLRVVPCYEKNKIQESGKEGG